MHKVAIIIVAIGILVLPSCTHAPKRFSFPRSILIEKEWESTYIYYHDTALEGKNGGMIQGRVIDAKDKRPLPFARIIISGTIVEAISDEDGYFILKDLKPGKHNIQIRFIGSKKVPPAEIEVRNGQVSIIIFLLALEEIPKTIIY